MSSTNKRFFWFKMSDDFFKNRNIVRLRKLAGGDTYVLIYIKMILKTIDNNGIYKIDEWEDLSEAMSIDLDEDIENVKVTLSFLKKCNLIEELDELTIKFVQVKGLTGSETASTIRSRKSRENKKALQCNTTATPLQHIATESKSKSIEKDIELELELDKEVDRELDKEVDREQEKSYNVPSYFILLNTFISDEEYEILCKTYTQELVDEKIKRSKNYKNCSNFNTISKWCKEEIMERVNDIAKSF